ncbi:MAG TPA: hypothetical protein VMN36_00950 [Verrucomicrobiales bacterium]|nr:hypothetical protein [Verrucomicrobiales bacterium]
MSEVFRYRGRSISESDVEFIATLIGANPGWSRRRLSAELCRARRISGDWQALYAHPVYLLETFIDPARFRGACYRAANWQCLGLTTGRGHNARTSRHDQPRKELWVYALCADFRRQLNPGFPGL